MHTVDSVYPPFGLRVVAGPLTLSAVRDEDIPPLIDLAGAGIHAPDRMPFAMPWTDASGPGLARKMTGYYWGTRAQFSPEQWTLDLVVRLDGQIVGVQGIATENYLVTRTGETGSWLGSAHQGRGLGTTMRRAMCALLFDHLGAAEITSAAFSDNPFSLAVSRKVGYAENGTMRVQRRPGELAVSTRLLLTPQAFDRGDVTISVSGVPELRHFIGLD